MSADEVAEPANEVRLRGRVSAAPQVRELPSGDEVCVSRIVVVREDAAPARADRRRSSVDAIDLAGWSARARRSMGSWAEGDEVEVTGALRRRFYRAGGATVSRVEVEVRTSRRVRRSARG